MLIRGVAQNISVVCRNRQTLLSIVVIVVGGIFLYAPTLTLDGFVWDDKSTIQTNPVVQHPISIKQIFETFNTRFIPGLSFVINRNLTGPAVFGFRLVNVIIHIVTAVAVYFFARTTLVTPNMKASRTGQRSALIPTLAGLLFLIHPIQTESVNLIMQRFTLIAAFFYVTAVWLYALARIKGSKILYGVSFLATVGAMFSRENCFTLPLAVVLYEFLFFPSWGNKFVKRMVFLMPFLGTMMIIPFLLYKTSTAVTHTARIAEPVYSAGSRPELFVDAINRISGTESEIKRRDFFITQLNVLRTDIRLLFWPASQNLDYDYPVAKRFFEPKTIFSAGFLVILFLIAILVRDRFRMIAFGILWFFLALSVESSVIPTTVINEHRLYLPMVGWVFIVSAVLTAFCRQRLIRVVVMVAVVLGLSATTMKRNALWQDEILLWTDTCQKSPRKARPLTNLGIAYKDRGDLDKAMDAFSRAIELDSKAYVAYTQLAFCYRFKGDNLKEEDLLQKAIGINPHYALAYFGLAYNYHVRGFLAQAVLYYEKALELDPSDEMVYRNLAIAYIKNNEPQKVNHLIEISKSRGNEYLAEQLANVLNGLSK